MGREQSEEKAEGVTLSLPSVQNAVTRTKKLFYIFLIFYYHVHSGMYYIRKLSVEIID